MNQIIYIPVGLKKYPLTLSKTTDPDFQDTENVIHVECKEAGINQERDVSDLGELLTVIPQLIQEKCEDKKKDTIHVRITLEEKNKIQHLAREKGYKNISSYIRETALAGKI